MTFTILALDTGHTSLGVATASRSLAVGATVPAIDSSAGVVASQAWTNPSLRNLLLQSLVAGENPQNAIARVPAWDTESARRQVAVLALDGRGAAHTGIGTTPWTGHLVHDGLVVAGNLLSSSEVLPAMIDAYGAPNGVEELAGALLRALRAGESAGGDSRGRQSAALLATEISSDHITFDLRVDDAFDPLSDLCALVRLRSSALRG